MQLQFGEPVEYEFYDLNKDPWQMKNVYNTAEGSDKLLVGLARIGIDFDQVI